MILRRLATLFSLAFLSISTTGSLIAQQHLAVSHGSTVTIFNPETAQIIDRIKGYRNIGKLTYRPDGSRLGLGRCTESQIIEFETSLYNEVDRHPTKNTCHWALTYSPDSQSLAATFYKRVSTGITPNVRGSVWIDGPQPLDRTLTGSVLLQPLHPALAYRPGGGELAIATRRGFTVISTATGYPKLTTVTGMRTLSLNYTTDGSRLLVGTSTGFQVRNAGAGYALVSEEAGGAVIDIAVAPSGGRVALVRETGVSVRRAPDLSEERQITSVARLRDADFASDGSLLAIAEQTQQLRRFRVGSWQELDAISISGTIKSIAFRPEAYGQRIPVLFVHGHSGNSAQAWFQPGSGANGTSVAAALSANSQLPIDAFYLELPVHNGTDNLSRSITDDAQDILAMIEGGLDTRGNTQVGILNMPAYQATGRVGIVGYSQGTLSSRYYIKNLMGSRRNGAITVSEFVTLAAPNHGVGDLLTCGNFTNTSMADRTRRQLCAGRVGTVQDCGCSITPQSFSNNQTGDNTFISDLNGHPLSDTCNANASFPGEAPFSRPTQADGILYVNLFGSGDTLVGDNSQDVDCIGRRKARNLAPDALNREMSGIPSLVHENVPHHFQVICTALKTVTDHQAPDAASPCDGLTPP